VLHPHSVPAEDFSLEVQSRVGLLYGLTKELVFWGSHIISELDWRFQPVLYTGAALSVQTRWGFSAGIDVRSAFPWRSGYIGDSDCLNYREGDFRQTHYSQHDCYTERAVILDARLGWVFRLGSAFSLEPFGAFGLMQFKWTARDGYLQYPEQSDPPYDPWSPSLVKRPVSGTGIVYEQTYLIPAAGLSARAAFAGRFDAELRFVFSPYLFCSDLDNHVQRAGFGSATDTDYHDELRGGFLLEPALSLGFRVSQRARLALDVSYRGIFNLIGDSSTVLAGPGLTPGLVDEFYADGALDASVSLSVSL
jgi:outer membrane protease